MNIIIWAQNKEEFAEAKREALKNEPEGRFTFSNIDQFDSHPSQHGKVDVAVVLGEHSKTDEIRAFYEKREVDVIVMPPLEDKALLAEEKTPSLDEKKGKGKKSPKGKVAKEDGAKNEGAKDDPPKEETAN